MTTGTAVIIGLAALLVMILIWLAISYNGFVKLRNSAEEAFAAMDVFLEKRYVLIPKLVNVAKRYLEPEDAFILEEATEAGNMAQRSATIEEKAANEPVLAEELRNLFAAAENYPELQANKTFINLKRQYYKIEEDIANAGKFYNAIVKMLNVRVHAFPSNLVAKLFHFARKPMIKADIPE